MDKFSIPFEDTKLAGDVMMHGNEKSSVLVLHGAGNASRARWQTLREKLLERGIGSYAFDFVGHGETGGELTSSSLRHRTAQALQVIKDLGIPTPLTIIGSSMGAYVGLKISETIPVESLIFFVPAMYDRTGYKVNFGPQFSEIIRQPRSWNNSDAWETLEKFTGKLLVIGGGKDETVPHELTQKIYDSATHAAKREIHFINESSHQIARFLIENPDELDKTIALIMNFLRA
jgi:uncharacterized protein